MNSSQRAPISTFENGKEIPARPVLIGLSFPALFIAGLWGAGHYSVVHRGDGWGSSTGIPLSLLYGCILLSILFGGLCLWTTKRKLKPFELIAASLVSLFVLALPFIFFCTMTFSVVALSLNGILDTSAAQTHQTTIRISRKFESKNCVYFVVHSVDWHNSQSLVRLNVNPYLPNVRKGQPLKVTTRRGFLGYEWIVNIEQ